MALTLNRPDYTAAQLNTLFDGCKSALSQVLPPEIKDPPNSVSFDSLTITDGLPISYAINDLESTIQALLILANSRDNGIGTFGLVRPQASGLEDPLMDADDYEYMIVVTDTYTRKVIFNKNSGSPDNLKEWSKLYSLNSSNSNADVIIQCRLYIKASSTPPIFSGSKVISDSGFGWRQSNNQGVELFNTSLGYNEWCAGERAKLTSSGFEQNNDKGIPEADIDNWFPGSSSKSYVLDSRSGELRIAIDPTIVKKGVEIFDSSGWPEGIKPTVPSGGSADCSIKTENLSSQANGSSTSFTTTKSFRTDCPIHVYWNGVRQSSSGDSPEVTIVNNNKFSTDFVPESGDELVVDYQELV